MVKNTLIIATDMLFSVCPQEEYHKLFAAYAKMKTAAVCLKMQEGRGIPSEFLKYSNRYSVPVLLFSADGSGYIKDILCSWLQPPARYYARRKPFMTGIFDSVFHFLSIYSVFFQKKGFKPQYMRV